MPANLTPDYLAAEKRFRAARTVSERIACLEEMLSTIPKHKGTDHMQADLKRRLSKLRQQSESKKTHGDRHQPWLVDRQGAGQVALIGAPNSGKSALLAALTNARPVVAAFPFSTQLPLPGMMDFEDAQIQLVDTPPIAQEFMEPWMNDVLRRADAALLLADLSSDDLLADLDHVFNRLEKIRIALAPRAPDSSAPGPVDRRCLVVATKTDGEGADLRLELLREYLVNRLPGGGELLAVIPVSAGTHVGLEELRRAVWDLLGMMRVYSKPPGRKPDLTQPYVVPMGSTLIELAGHIHKDFVDSLKHARVWGADGGPGSARFPGQMVERDHVLRDRDVVELHH